MYTLLAARNNPSGFADANPPPLAQGRQEVRGFFGGAGLSPPPGSLLPPGRRDKVIFLPGNPPSAPLCKGSCHGFAVTEGLTVNATPYIPLYM